MNPALSLALVRVLPTREQTLLLRACLSSGQAQREAWASWQDSGSDLVDLLRRGPPEVRRLAPLLFVALRDSAAPVGKALLTILRTAHLHEEMRSREYRRVCAAVLSALEAAGTRFIVFRGAALGETVYGDPALRHSHDVNLLVQDADLPRAVDILARSGCKARYAGVETDALIVDHESGLPILLHSRFFRISFYRSDWEAIWGRAGTGRVAGRMVRLLSPADALLFACCQASHSVRLQPFGWAADAYLIMQRSPDLNWTELLESARRSRTEVPAHIALGYLARELGAPVPGSVLASLAAATTTVDPVERDVALMAARSRGGMRLRTLLRGSAPPRVKLLSLRWLLLPSRGYLEWAYGRQRSVTMPLVYLERLARYVARRTAWRLRRDNGATRRVAASERPNDHHMPEAAMRS
jgi:hypothetical protein